MAHPTSLSEARFVEQNGHLTLEGGSESRLLHMTGIHKSFGTTRAVQDIDLEVRGSEVVALMGGNGAGKSTLMKIVGGLVSPDQGRLELLGKVLGDSHAPRDALALGLRFVHQELSLCQNLRVFENFAIELPDLIRGVGWKSQAIDHARTAMQEVFPGCSIDPRAKVGALSLSQQQMVEIARATGHPKVRLLILDEPTSSLGSREAAQLHDYIKRRREGGISFIFISHRLQESLEVADRIMVMRNGRLVWTGQQRQRLAIPADRASRRQAAEACGAQSQGPREETLWSELSNVRAGILRGVSFSVARGEIVGLAGLEGGGQRQVLRSMYASFGKRRQ